MDKEYRIISLDEAFKEALSLSEGESCKQEIFESNLLALINSNEDFLNGITDEYKERMIKSWDYEIDYKVWESKVNPIQSSISEYPNSVNTFFIKDLVSDIHSNKDDLYEEDILERISEYSHYSLYEVNISDIEWDSYMINDDIVDEYSEMDINTMPPIVLGDFYFNVSNPEGRFTIIDGAHRSNALRKLGISKIKAYIPNFE